MLKIKNWVFASALLLPQFFFAQYTDVINSNRPGETMSAYAVGKTVIQAEMGLYGINEKHDLLGYKGNGMGTDLTIRYGAFLEKLEFIADIQYQMENFTTPFSEYKKNDFRQTILGAKYLIYDPFKGYEKTANIYSYKANHAFKWRQLIPAVSVFAGANFTFKDNPYSFSPESSISPKIMLITQNHFGDGRWVLVSNIIADYISTDYPSYGYVLTLTRGFNDRWSGFLENQGFKSDFYSDAILRGGAAYLLSKNMQVDASISSNFKNTPSILYGGIGFSWRYDAKYKEVQLQNKKDQKEKDYQAEERKRKSKYE
ncbi:transporter [Flavobacterium sp. Fl-77]|uniref:Transporter n=1 Tax=Flavobacterium flavipigmentatum TaxID=2893884 RepID=A0AAJ2S7B2_9FLAO|nr:MULTISPECIES: transporter [unclassified Flavobacterium]MDX6181755.1 transporter [Flavobacterium sp. Fl-33]MDX6185211.1 transporter [Flavobacterium sp. Fl-77]UFH37318.1 transporter [Flavobacterium sp. F-70]